VRSRLAMTNAHGHTTYGVGSTSRTPAPAA
jgi:hypothetical protein